MKSPHIFSRFWQSMPSIAGHSLIGALVIVGLVAVGSAAIKTFSADGINRSLAGELSPTVSGQSTSDKVVIKRQPTTQCSTDNQCGGGQMCYSGQCKSIFECKPFVNAKWQKGDSPDLNGTFEVRNPEYVSMVPIGSGITTSDSQAVRFSGGSLGTHTFERVILKKFDQPKEVWGGVIEVNPKNIQHYVNGNPVVFLGGYTDTIWPESGSGTWWRDLTADFTNDAYVPASKPGKKSGVSSNAFYHDASAPNLVYTPFWILDAKKGWQDRFVKVEWYFTPQHKFYMRVDGKEWTQANANINPASPEYYKFKGFSVGWVSARSGGSLDIRSVRLHDSSCLPSINPQGE